MGVRDRPFEQGAVHELTCMLTCKKNRFLNSNVYRYWMTKHGYTSLPMVRTTQNTHVSANLAAFGVIWPFGDSPSGVWRAAAFLVKMRFCESNFRACNTRQINLSRRDESFDLSYVGCYTTPSRFCYVPTPPDPAGSQICRLSESPPPRAPAC